MSANSPNGKSPKAPWYGEGLSFQCTQCGNCCTGPSGVVWFNDDEARTMADQLGLSVTEFRRRYAHRHFGRWTLDEVRQPDGNYDCVFLRRDPDGKGRCSMYGARPTQCRTWPFWPSNLRSERAWQEASKTCPGMRGGGQFVPADQIRIQAKQTPRGL